MRGSSAVTLWTFVLIGGFLQVFLGSDGLLPGSDGSGDLRLHVLTAGTVISVILAAAVVPLLLRPSVGTAARHPLVIALFAVSGLTWLVALVAPFAGWAWGFMLAIAGGILSCLVRRWWTAAVILGTLCFLAFGGTAAGGLAEAWPLTASGLAAGATKTSAAGTDLVIVSTLLFITFTPLSTIWVLRVVLRLEEARRTASELAVATERLRFATDLHDIQGHHLQVIALKSELAERRLLADDSALAAQELAGIRQIAQTALEDTRAVVNDYRTVTVAVEARNAAAVLRSAGITCEARIDAPDLPASVGAVFAVAIREAATNILRHSKATTATLDLIQSGSSEFRLIVENNGSGVLRTGGTGLPGIAERVATWDGTVETRRNNDTFTLIVRIPVPAAQHRAGVMQ